MAFEGHVFFLAGSGSKGNSKKAIADTIRDHGGLVEYDLSAVVDHVVAFQDDVFDSIEVDDHRKIVPPSWIVRSAEAGVLQPYPTQRRLFLKRAVISTTQIPTPFLENIASVVRFHGGDFTTSMSKRCTHLIALRRQGAKVTFATLRGIPVVTPQWLEECVKVGSQVPAAAYLCSELSRSEAAAEGSNRPNVVPASLAQTMPQTAPLAGSDRCNNASEHKVYDAAETREIHLHTTEVEVLSEAHGIELPPTVRADPEEIRPLTSANQRPEPMQSMRNNARASVKADERQVREVARPKGGVFEGVVFVIRVRDRDVESQLRSGIKVFGGCLAEDLNGDYSHLVVDFQSEAVAQAVSLGKIAVTVFWIKACISRNALVPVGNDCMFSPLPDPAGIHGMRGLNVSVTGAYGADRFDLVTCIRYAGVTFNGDMRKGRDHMLVFYPPTANSHKLPSEKPQCAGRWGIVVVLSAWIMECLRRWRFVPVEDYLYDQTQRDLARSLYLRCTSEPNHGTLAGTPVPAAASAGTLRPLAPSPPLPTEPPPDNAPVHSSARRNTASPGDASTLPTPAINEPCAAVGPASNQGTGEASMVAGVALQPTSSPRASPAAHEPQSRPPSKAPVRSSISFLTHISMQAPPPTELSTNLPSAAPSAAAASLPDRSAPQRLPSYTADHSSTSHVQLASTAPSVCATPPSSRVVPAAPSASARDVMSIAHISPPASCVTVVRPAPAAPPFPPPTSSLANHGSAAPPSTSSPLQLASLPSPPPVSLPSSHLPPHPSSSPQRIPRRPSPPSPHDDLAQLNASCLPTIVPPGRSQPQTRPSGPSDAPSDSSSAALHGMQQQQQSESTQRPDRAVQCGKRRAVDENAETTDEDVQVLERLPPELLSRSLTPRQRKRQRAGTGAVQNDVERWWQRRGCSPCSTQSSQTSVGHVASPCSTLATQSTPVQTRYGARRVFPSPTFALSRLRETRHVFLLAGFNAPQRMAYVQIIESLGGTVAGSSTQHEFEPCSHVLLPEVKRTQKYLCGCAAGVWFMRPRYLDRCNTEGSFLPEEPFEWHEDRMSSDGKLWLGSMRRARQSRALHGPVFTHVKALIIGVTEPSPEMLSAIIRAGSGTVLHSSDPAAVSSATIAIIGDTHLDNNLIRECQARNLLCVRPLYFIEHLAMRTPKPYEHYLYPETSRQNAVVE